MAGIRNRSLLYLPGLVRLAHPHPPAWCFLGGGRYHLGATLGGPLLASLVTALCVVISAIPWSKCTDECTKGTIVGSFSKLVNEISEEAMLWATLLFSDVAPLSSSHLSRYWVISASEHVMSTRRARRRPWPRYLRLLVSSSNDWERLSIVRSMNKSISFASSYRAAS
jgi:hypothetical protein